ncbi:hypothetical protein L873DRAFT_659403 [Choiromyces venosus 120613-1]|uniref:Uncharacterized protein n=1 Tax=Choiromyces venosus 120613-1 TaxID=1336337 RepID=A0A3N4K6C3_9PEZI|nr:hypothetical protein L873DRAFT_659403 [Choiromyces venosus 120613-1]
MLEIFWNMVPQEVCMCIKNSLVWALKDGWEVLKLYFHHMPTTKPRNRPDNKGQHEVLNPVQPYLIDYGVVHEDKSGKYRQCEDKIGMAMSHHVGSMQVLISELWHRASSSLRTGFWVHVLPNSILHRVGLCWATSFDIWVRRVCVFQIMHDHSFTMVDLLL